jgi:antitoxin ParD1/3/4
MNVSLTPELEALINAKVSGGRYKSADEVVGEALRLLETRDREREAARESLKREIQIGMDQVERGEVVSGDEVFAELREMSRKMRRQSA